MKVLFVDDSSLVCERLKAMISEVPRVETISQAKDQLEAPGLLKKMNPEKEVMKKGKIRTRNIY